MSRDVSKSDDSGEWLVKSSRKRQSQKPRAVTAVDYVTTAVARSTGQSTTEHGQRVYSQDEDIGLLSQSASSLTLPVIMDKSSVDTSKNVTLQDNSGDHRQPTINFSPSKQLFAQKVQSGCCFKNMKPQQLPNYFAIVAGESSHVSEATGSQVNKDVNVPVAELSSIHQEDNKCLPVFNDQVISKNQFRAQEIAVELLNSQDTYVRDCQAQAMIQRKKKGSNKKDKFRSKLPPQDTRICIIDKSLKEKWMQSDSVKATTLTKNVSLQEEDFPDLTFALRRLSKYSIHRAPHVLSDSYKEEEKAENTYPLESLSGKLETKENQKKKQPRMKDPISVNIFDIIKEQTGTCPKLSTTNALKLESRCDDKWKHGGNMLDSSNPIRKRGKHREGPAKKKLSKLKYVILNERRKKNEERNLILSIPKQTMGEPKALLGEPSDDPLSVKLSYLCIKVDDFCDHKENASKESQEDKLNEVFIDSSNCDDSKLDTSFPLYNAESQIEDIDRDSLEVKQDQTNTKHQSDLTKCDNFSNFLSIHTDNIGSSTNSEMKESLTSSCDKNSQQIVLALHSRKFRDYCDNIKSQDLDEITINLIKEIYRFQDRHYHKEPIRAHAKRRFVLGFREVRKFLTLRKLRAIVIAPDLEPVKAPGGLDDTIRQIREDGRFQQIPVIFAVDRRKLGFALKKKVPISIVGIINPEGAEELYQSMLDKWREASKIYQQKVKDLSDSLK